jgi:protein-S-isoprenylcysteine O-methyltransferase Ste14
MYAGGMAVCCHLFVVGYEERTLSPRFGETYLVYVRTVPRWIPRPRRLRQNLIPLAASAVAVCGSS